MLPSKISPTTSPARLMTGEPELPPIMSAELTKLKAVDRASWSRLLTVPLGQVKRRLQREAARPVVESEEGRLRRRHGAVHRIALDRSECEPERKGGLGIDRSAVDRKARLAQFFTGRGSSRLSTLVSCHLSNLADSGFDPAGKLYRRVFRSGDGAFSLLDQRFPERGIGQLRPLELTLSPLQPGRGPAGRL